MRKITLVLLGTLIMVKAYPQKKEQTVLPDRKNWLRYLDKVARPVMFNLANDQLKEKMPVILPMQTDNKASRTKAAYLEAYGRTLSGIAPWLNLEGGDIAEVKLRNQYREWAIKATTHAVDPKAKDYMLWEGGQPLVDASFVALALIRCPWLWDHLNADVKQQVIEAFKVTRKTVPVYSNWVLFTGMIEAFFCRYDLENDPVRTEYGIREFTQHWYVGDGMYADGMQFHMDYYNSIVIQPYLNVILQVQNDKTKKYLQESRRATLISRRYCEILERCINPDGSYPASGRSIVYRAGSFHQLANSAYLKDLPATLPPAQIRSALTAVIKKTLESPLTFTSDGWLNIGLYGNQPGLADVYNTTGSLYICLNAFLPLGLSESDEFWSKPPMKWTSVKIWNGEDVKGDHALDLKDK